MKFRTVIELGGKTATGFEVPAEVVESLGRGKRPPVQVTIGPHTYPSTVAVMDGRYLVPLSAENREAAGVAAGDEVQVELIIDEAPRSVEVPDDLGAALDAEPEARRTFDALSNSNRKWHVLQVTGAKTDETRARRIERSVAMLREGRAR
ncbi:MAG TPA: YdeI/OmpD-associated family protein [Candidatus Angelobacter sp.]|nr:YdeI/OmpD-associated family protein [Candidatus Angelobacter sp.]